jgi:membrane-associated protease RseP (regulator of RpoE activity)
VTDPAPDDAAKQPSKLAQALVVGGSAEPPKGDLASSPWRLALLGGFIGTLGVAFGWSWVVIIVALSVMIFLHEVGHFVTAKWAGMKVTEFCILGIGPKIWSMRRGETEYMIRLVPVAAYVRIIGMNNLDDTDPADEPRTFRQQSFPKRLLVMSGGSLMHFAQALVLFFVVFAFIGVPGRSGLAQQLGGPEPRWGVVDVLDGEAAKAAGVRSGDEIVSIGGARIDDADDIKDAIQHRAGDTLPIVVLRDGAERTLPVTVGENPDDPRRGFLGIVTSDFDEPMPSVTTSAGDSVFESFRASGEIISQTVRGLGSFATGGLDDFAARVVGDDDDGGGPVVSGEGSGQPGREVRRDEVDENRPISIYGVARIGAESDLAELLILLAVVNVSIGLINLLPLLPLDGGHIAIAVYERLRSRRGHRHMADVSRLLPLTYAVVLVLGLLMMSSLYLDIVDPVGV